jgi:hypothetical protein
MLIAITNEKTIVVGIMNAVNFNEHKRTSDLLKDIANAPDHGQISIGRFVEMLGDRSFALSILIFSLPNSLPVPGIPGFSTLTGIPILLIALQIMFGRSAIWLPEKVAEKHFSHAIIVKIVNKALPVISWLERYIKPRMTFMCESLGERAIGFLIVVMSIILALPIVGGNFLPGFSISLMALALLENDGIFAIFSMVFALCSVYIMYEIIYFVLSLAIKWMLGFF